MRSRSQKLLSLATHRVRPGICNEFCSSAHHGIRQQSTTATSQFAHLQRYTYTQPLANYSVRYSSSSDDSKSANNDETKLDKEKTTIDAVTPSSDVSPPHYVIPGAQTGGRKLAIVFTCTVCETRSIKQFTERAYQHGVVLVRCPGCQNLHLIADRLGYFDDQEWDIEAIAKSTGQEIQKVNDVMEIDLEKLLGPEKYKNVLRQAETNEKPVT